MSRPLPIHIRTQDFPPAEVVSGAHVMKTIGTVVVADDTEMSRDLLAMILRRDGYIVHTARDGAEGPSS